MLHSGLVLSVILALTEATIGGKHNELVVKSSSGTYIGLINGTTPNVRQFLKVPFAAAPIGERRWLPPAKLESDRKTVFDATQFPPSCPQYVSRIPTIYNTDVPEYPVFNDDQSQTAGESSEETSEDCLHLAIWTPTGRPKKLPVILYFTGGAYVSGGVNIPYQLPHNWVERTKSHIVVTINYRLNILGFPNAAGLEDQNLGLLDQRTALEWVHENIEAFGGDAEKITLWGQSAGGASVDLQNFAYPDDPIVKGLFLDSGTVLLGIISPDPTFSNFSFVASNFDCGGLDGQAELACMRKIPADDILNFFGQYGDNGTQPPVTFYPVVDEKVIYSNYTERYAQGLYSKVPAIISHTSNEGAGAVPYPPTNAALRDQLTQALFLCPAAESSRLRANDDSITYRLEWAGNFSNVSPEPYLGAYHSSDLPFIFGTHSDFRGRSTDAEFAVSESIQDHVLAFMKDPVNGPAKLGWEPYSEGQILQFGLDDVVVQRKPVAEIDGVCTSSAAPLVSRMLHGYKF